MKKDNTIKLTELASSGGCSAKWSPRDLRDILTQISPGVDEAMMLGFETSDDAAVWMLRDDLCAVLTADFFNSPVDDPYEFGRIAAANALSDVWAMGAQPHMALNLLAMDITIGVDVASDILRGGAEAVCEAGAVVAGGHTIADPSPKYGLCVFGTAHPDELVFNKGAQVGDVLYLTKPLGTGITIAAHRIGLAPEEDLTAAKAIMMELNKGAAYAMQKAHAHACTDITGFGLAGHLHEMMEASGCGAEINHEALPLQAHVAEYALAYCLPSRSFETAEYAESFLKCGSADMDQELFDAWVGIVCDAQTSGGLLVAVSAKNAAIFERACAEQKVKTCARIGSVIEAESGTILMK